MDTNMWQLIPYDHTKEELVELPPTMTGSYDEIAEEVDFHGYEVHNQVQVTRPNALPGADCVAIIRRVETDA